MLLGVVSLIPNPWSKLGVDAGYGFQGSLAHFEPDHRLTLRGTWDGVLVLGAGAQGSRDGQWTALWEFRIDVGRFSLGVVREGLPNDFGAAHFFQATIGLN
jgi:hypothetical protein